jgi:Tfp pilus assembly protein PilV
MTKPRANGGFTLLEIMISLMILVLCIIGLLSVIAHTTRQNQVDRENLIALKAAESKIEEMRQFKVEEIYSRYNANAGDDALYAGLHPGPTFRFSVSATDDGQGTLSFPGDGTNLIEDPLDPDPIARDLNLNGIPGDLATANYVVLPVTVSLTWNGIRGPRTLTYRTMTLKKK